MQKISFLFIARLTLLEDVQLHSSHSYPIYFYNRTKSFLLQLTMTCSFCSIIPGTTPHIPSHLISEGLFYRIQLQLSHIPMLVYHDLTIFCSVLGTWYSILRGLPRTISTWKKIPPSSIFPLRTWSSGTVSEMQVLDESSFLQGPVLMSQ